MVFDGVQSGIADHMFDPAGVLRSRLRIHTQKHQCPAEYRVALIDLPGGGATQIGQVQEAVSVHFQIAVLLQKSYGAADAGTGIIQRFCRESWYMVSRYISADSCSAIKNLQSVLFCILPRWDTDCKDRKIFEKTQKIIDKPW